MRPDDTFRDALERDSIDFMSLVELLSERTDLRIEEDDYPALTKLADATDFLAARTCQETAAHRVGARTGPTGRSAGRRARLRHVPWHTDGTRHRGET
ncbi:hypothetical protein AB0B50_00340 [Streptomyces sp. NPDC041068]|uniref:acyl carrier protein n=1 Tax=Streptomyces sp. NPDC041068 TaxID=3155130 RepID=UPI0033CA8A96